MPILEESSYSAPYLFRNPHLASLLPFAIRWSWGKKYTRERIDTPDGDFLDMDWLRGENNDLLLVLSHGLEGSSQSPHCLGMARYFHQRGWDVMCWNFRSCSGEMNRVESFYHGGMVEDLDLVVKQAMTRGNYRAVVLMGISLGGNLTLKYLGEMGQSLHPLIKKAVTFSTPVNLAASADHISTNYPSSYTRYFLYSYRKKLIAKSKIMPLSYSLEPLAKIKSLREFDAVYNAPLYHFRDADHFYRETSAVYVMNHIRIPTLIVNAQNDPFLPENCYPVKEARQNDHIFLEMPYLGGHAGFIAFEKTSWYWSENRAWKFLEDIHGNQFEPEKQDKKGWVQWGKEKIWWKNPE